MSFNDHLIHLCTIKRPAGDSTDSFGEDDSAEDLIIADTPCRLVDKTQRTAKPAAGEMAIGGYLLLLPANTDVQRGDTVEVPAPGPPSAAVEAAPNRAALYPIASKLNPTAFS